MGGPFAAQRADGLGERAVVTVGLDLEELLVGLALFLEIAVCGNATVLQDQRCVATLFDIAKQV